MAYKIPHLFEAIADYLKTENGKQALIEYVIENELWDEELIKEIKNYDTGKK